jgi:hypothetical protein
MTVPERRRLLDEHQIAREWPGRGPVRGFVPRGDDNPHLADAGGEDLLDEDEEGGLGTPVAVHERLQRERPLIASGTRDESAACVHDVMAADGRPGPE